MPTMSEMYARVGVVLVMTGACTGEISHNDAPVHDRSQDCVVLDFDTDGSGDPILAGHVVEGAYQSIGVSIDVWDDSGQSDDGLGVAFDSDAPTGGDTDLSFTGLGNLLINQERFDSTDVANGFVSEPDDQACGALFEFRFADPVCVDSLVLLDIDFGEDPAVIELFDSAGNHVATHSVNPMGDNVRLDVSLPATGACDITRMTVLLSSSGAMDNVVICRTRNEPEIWTRVYDGGADERGNDVATDSARNVIVAGTGFNGADDDGLVRKYDSSGGLLWSAAIDRGDDDRAAAVAVTPGDQIVVAGNTFNGTDRDLLVRKLDSDGTELWTRVFDGGGEDGALGVSVNASGDIAVAGFVTIGGGTDMFVRVYSSSGATLWTHTEDIGAGDAAHGVAFDAAGALFLAGQSDSGTDFDVWLRKLDSNGAELWTRVFDGGGDDGARGVAVDSGGNAVVGGLAWNGSNADVFVRKYSATGATVWTRSFDGGGVDAAEDVAVDAADNVVVTGWTTGATIDGWTRKYGPSGAELWTELFDRNEDDTARGVAVDIAGSVVATGTFDNGTDLDLWIEKYRP